MFAIASARSLTRSRIKKKASHRNASRSRCAAMGAEVRLLSRTSAPIAAQRLLEAFRWLAFFLILERVSDRALAIANIVYACYVVFWIPTEGFAETSCSMVSRFVGRNQT